MATAPLREAARRAYKAARPWFWSYVCAKRRCTDKRHRSYEGYAGKGISFQLTMAEVEELWHRDGAARMVKANLDRKCAKEDYFFDNCRFIEKSKNTTLANVSRAAGYGFLTEPELTVVVEWGPPATVVGTPA